MLFDGLLGISGDSTEFFKLNCNYFLVSFDYFKSYGLLSSCRQSFYFFFEGHSGYIPLNDDLQIGSKYLVFSLNFGPDAKIGTQKGGSL